MPVAGHEGLRHRHHADAAGGAAPAVHSAAATALRDGSGSPLSLEGMASGSDDDGPDRPVEPQDGAPVAEPEPEPQPTRTREEDAAPAVAAAEPLWRWMLLGGGCSSFGSVWRLEVDGPGVLSLMAVELGYWAAVSAVNWLAVDVLLVVAIVALSVWKYHAAADHETTRCCDLMMGCCMENLGQRNDKYKKARKWREWFKRHRHDIRDGIKSRLWWGVPLLTYVLLRFVVLLFVAGGEWHSLPQVMEAVNNGCASLVSDLYKEVHRGFIRYGLVVWLGKQAFGLRDFIFASERELFRMRVNISLNLRKKVQGAYKFQMRTVDECSCNEFLPGLDSILAESMDSAKVAQDSTNLQKRLKGRFIRVPRRQAKQINDQIVNRLSKLFGKTYLQDDMDQDVEQKAYIYAMTYEHDEANNADEDFGHKLVKKFRLLLIEQDRFTEMTNKRITKAAAHRRTPATEPSPRVLRETLARGVSITDTDALKWEGCRYKCKYCVQHETGDGLRTPGAQRECDCRSCFCEVVDEERLWQCPPCGRNNRCYGSDRIRDLVVMRALLQEENQLVSKKGQQGAWSVDKFEFTSWKRRGVTSGGPPKGTWPFRRGDQVTVQGRGGTFTVQQGDEEGTAGKLSVYPTTVGGAQGPAEPVCRSLCDFAPGFDFDMADAEGVDSEARRQSHAPPLPREPCDEKARKALRKWADEPITIAGTLFIAVPHAHSSTNIASEVVRATPPTTPAPSETGSPSLVLVKSASGGQHVESSD